MILAADKMSKRREGADAIADDLEAGEQRHGEQCTGTHSKRGRSLQFGRRSLRNRAKLQCVFAFAAGQFERMLRQRGLELFHLTGIGEVDLRVVQRTPDDVHPGYRLGGAQPRAERRPILNGIEPHVYSEVRAGVIGRRERAIDGLFPLTRCVDHRLGEDNVRPAQQLTHRFRIEMKCDVGEVARRVAPYSCRRHC